MNLTPFQTRALEDCARLLKTALGGLKRVVFDLVNENQDDRVHWEIHGREKIRGEKKKV